VVAKPRAGRLGRSLRLLRTRTPGDVLFDIIVYGLSALIFFVVAYPLYFVVIASVSNANMVANGLVVFWPRDMSLFGYNEIFKDTRIWLGYRNTLIYSFGGTAVNLLFTLPAAYALSRAEFRPRRLLMLLFVFTLFFNGGLIPTYLLMRNLGLINNMLVFIIPFCVNVFNLIITRSFFEYSIPHELFEAASMDGCTHLRFFGSVVLPLSKAVVSVVALYYLVAHWNDFFTALIYIQRDRLKPLTIILRDILLTNQVFASGTGIGGQAGGYAQQYADAVKYGVIIVSSVPILIVYPFIQKYFEKGVLIGAIKG
jgi:putative aldouronate transport system permease protein